ncbi:protein phosphatase 1 regulatory subunit 15A [Microcebus murinus]|uniref:protein phosphatase 1 regulatory subunit 15A n=1 Tax=Microcebus murinus TaxID=30608 RepID=UPI003F6D5207
MAPGQAPHQAVPWRDSHPISLLYPLLGFFSRAWSLVRGPGPAKPWMVAAVTEGDQVEAGQEGEAKAPLAGHQVPRGRQAQGEAEDSGAPKKDREAANLKTRSCLLEAWGFSDDDEYYEERRTSVPKEQGRAFTDGQLAPLSPGLLIRTLQGSDKNPREEKLEEVGAAEDDGVTESSYPLSHQARCAAVDREGDGKAVNNGAPRTPHLSPGPKPRTWVYCPREEEDQATEEERRESKEARKTSVSPSPAGSNPKAQEFCSGKKSGDKDEVALEEAAEPEPHSSVPAQRPLLRSWENQPSKCTEEDDEEDEDGALGAAEKDRGAEGPSPISPPSDFLKAWVYRPGEDTEEEEDEEEEDSDSGSAEEEGEAEASPSTPPMSPFLKAWVYRPGEDTEEEEEEEEEESDSELAEEVGEAEASPAIPPTNPFLKAWVYRPGEDTEEEEEDKDDEAADSDRHPSLGSHSALLRAWMYRPGEETEEEEATEECGEAEPCPFRVAIYVPGEKPPPPWSPPKLPLRLQRQLKFSETPTRDPDPETPLKARKVRFSEKVTVRFLYVWAGPAQAARRGPWEQLARDRSRFARRIAQAQEELGPCLTPAARARAWARLGNPLPALNSNPAPT